VSSVIANVCPELHKYTPPVRPSRLHVWLVIQSTYFFSGAPIAPVHNYVPEFIVWCRMSHVVTNLASPMVICQRSS
jgi:hypothetical protein